MTRFALDIIMQYGHLFGVSAGASEDVVGTQLGVEFDANVHLLPLVAFRPPNQPTKFSAALLAHFNVLNVRTSADVCACVCELVGRCRCFIVRDAPALTKITIRRP